MVRIEKLLREEWLFHRGDVNGAENPSFDDGDWEIVNIPHDWSIHGKFTFDQFEYWAGFQNLGHRIGYLPQGRGWYRYSFVAPESWNRKHVTIIFDGVYRNADVWINGNHLGFHPYGYTPFHHDLTPQLKLGKTNVIAVRVDNWGVSSRWYAGSGIYRDVRLVVTDLIHVDTWGTCITTPEISPEQARVDAQVRIKNSGSSESRVEFITTAFDGNKEIVSASDTITVLPGTHEYSSVLQMPNPVSWSVTNPHLYRLRTTLKQDGRVIDEYDTSFGIREFHFDPDDGFFLNGVWMKIKGVCLHHDNGCLGSVEHVKAIERKLRILREMGCNAIRTSHNPPSELFLDCCDRMGFMVMDEAFDEWKIFKTPWSYGHYYDEWHVRDMESFITRDRNHPSIILWSVGNEIAEQKTVTGAAMCKELVGIFHRLDPTRPVTSGANHPVEGNETGFNDHLDVVGYNYFGDRVLTIGAGSKFTCEYDREHEKYPDRVLLGSENVSANIARGVYQFPVPRSKGVKVKDDFLCAAYDITTEPTLLIMKTRPYVSGCFIWEGFDYIGEPTPYQWPERSSNFGIVDLAGFPKDTYFLYKSQWVDEPVVHIVPQNWNWEVGMTIPVWVYSNCEVIELHLNGALVGEVDIAEWEEDGALHGEIDVPFEPGELVAIGKNKGVAACKDIVRTSGRPRKLLATVQDVEIKADEHDITFIQVEVQDGDGTFVPDADVLVFFTVNGPGRIIGVDNGNPASHEPLDGDQIHAFNGFCLAILQSMDTTGEIEVVASAPGLKSSKILVKATKKEE